MTGNIHIFRGDLKEVILFQGGEEQLTRDNRKQHNHCSDPPLRLPTKQMGRQQASFRYIYLKDLMLRQL